MHPVKKILVLHGETRGRRRLVLPLADAGYDLRAFGAAEAALESARAEWFDLALVANDAEDRGFAFAEELKRVQPAVPIVLLVSALELPSVVRGIRAGLADVIAGDSDPAAVRSRVQVLLGPLPATSATDVLTAGELSEVESLLARMDAGKPPTAPAGSVEDWPAELVRAARERTALETQLAQLRREKDAVDAELRTLLAQGADGRRLQAELDELRTQRELAAATQAAIDAKASRLAETRAEIARERAALDAARARPSSSAPESPVERALAERQAAFDLWRQDLLEEQERLRDEAARLRQEAAQIAHERRRWQDDLELLASREENLRAYESRLRQLQSDLERERVGRRPPIDRDPLRSAADEAEVRELWAKLQRATELLEADRTVFRDERLALREFEQALRRREEAVRQREATLVEPPREPASATPAPATTRLPLGLWNRRA